VYGTKEIRRGRKKIGWAQAIYPLRARLQELKNNALLDKRDEALDDELMELTKGELAFLATRPKLIQAGYTSLDSIPRTQKGNATRFFCPALKGMDSTTQAIVTKWIQLLHKHPAHLHALDTKDAQKQRDLGIKPLVGITTAKLADKYIIKRNKIRNQIALLCGHVETGVVFFLDHKSMRQPSTNLENSWHTPGRPEGKGNYAQNGEHDTGGN